MPQVYSAQFHDRKGSVLNWASLIDQNALEQALQQIVNYKGL